MSNKSNRSYKSAMKWRDSFLTYLTSMTNMTTLTSPIFAAQL
jgi:hypothetical protein